MIKPSSTYVENFKWIWCVWIEPEWSVLLIPAHPLCNNYAFPSFKPHFSCISFASFSKFCHSLLIFKNAVASCLWFLVLFSVLDWGNKTWKWLLFFFFCSTSGSVFLSSLYLISIYSINIVRCGCFLLNLVSKIERESCMIMRFTEFSPCHTCSCTSAHL